MVDGEILEEEWAEVRNFPNYIVSNYGRVVSTRLDEELTLAVRGWGYYDVQLFVDGNKRSKLVHRLVAEHFVPGWDHGLVVDHLNGDKVFNVETNLEWVTVAENNRRAYLTGLNRGRGRPVRIVEIDQEFESLKTCAEFLGVTKASIFDAVSGRRPRCKGFTFTYI